MPLGFLTREVFDVLILICIGAGLALAVLRLRADFSRPLPPDDDTQPRR